MSRYRPPSEPKTPYITRAGYDHLKAEEKTIWSKRAEVTAALSAAAAEGDRSENAEYIYRKKELREIDRRIRYLQKRLPDLKVVDQPPSVKTQVFFGARVELEDDNGELHLYRIVGPDEIDHAEHYISIDSPLARALMKKHLDDDVSVQTPGGETNYVIVNIEYHNPAA